jgi:hypothetical protein
MRSCCVITLCDSKSFTSLEFIMLSVVEWRQEPSDSRVAAHMDRRISDKQLNFWNSRCGQKSRSFSEYLIFFWSHIMNIIRIPGHGYENWNTSCQVIWFHCEISKIKKHYHIDLKEDNWFVWSIRWVMTWDSGRAYPIDGCKVIP